MGLSYVEGRGKVAAGRRQSVGAGGGDCPMSSQATRLPPQSAAVAFLGGAVGRPSAGGHLGRSFFGYKLHLLWV